VILFYRITLFRNGDNEMENKNSIRSYPTPSLGRGGGDGVVAGRGFAGFAWRRNPSLPPLKAGTPLPREGIAFGQNR